ncbi:MAG: hypothetical protein E7335_00680 [Clostridiales bacterium]|nr:hypothetical protein [Clostridiales bacterium]
MSGKIKFYGAKNAELFTKELDHSLKGAIEHLMDMDPASPSYGFAQASFDGRPWTDTMWTRDAGVMLRELSCYGMMDEARALANSLINLVQENEKGFFTFPERFERNKPDFGHELDGTASIVIGMVFLLRRLDAQDETKKRVEEFLWGEKSPLKYAQSVLSESPLLSGDGEFGGGCGIQGRYVNVVQNALVRAMLIASAQYARETGRDASVLEETAQRIREGIEKYLVNENGAWIWCVSPDTMQPDPAIINHEINKGFGGLNDVLALTSEIEGVLAKDDKMVQHGRAMLDELYSFPRRKQLFDSEGLWIQFDEYQKGSLTSFSYGQCYAVQAMAMADRIEWFSRGLNYLAEAAFYNNTPVVRKDPYWFFERVFAGDRIAQIDTWEGCGALNLVNMAEPLKVARLAAGIDCTSKDAIVIAPRLPINWSGVAVENWVLPNKDSLVPVSMRYEKVAPGACTCSARMTAKAGEEGYALYWDCAKKADVVRFGPFASKDIEVTGGKITSVYQSEDGFWFAETEME